MAATPPLPATMALFGAYRLNWANAMHTWRPRGWGVVKLAHKSRVGDGAEWVRVSTRPLRRRTEAKKLGFVFRPAITQ